MHSKVLLAGVSTRAAAESAARAGFAVPAIDAFADADQHPAVHAQALRDRFSADAAALLARTIPCDAVAYGMNFEKHPGTVTLLAWSRALEKYERGDRARARSGAAVAGASSKSPARGRGRERRRIPNPESRIPR